MSLCPSITETLFVLGAGERVIGRTRFCIHPDPAVKSARNVGGTKDVNYPLIASLQPDLIVAEKEENTQEIVAMLEQEYPVFVSDVKTVSDALRLIRDLGELTGFCDAANEMANQIQSQLPKSRYTPEVTYAYMIWKAPEMGVGQDTYIDDLMSRFNFRNALSDLPGRYPSISLEELESKNPDIVLLSSEPYPFQEKERAFFAQQLPHSKVLLIDGEVAWYGARMVKALRVLRELRATVALSER